MHSRLRHLIRQIILEAYEMTPEDEAGLKPFLIEKGGMMANIAKQNKDPHIYRVNVANMRRALGRQYPEEQQKDRDFLKRMHKHPEYQSLVKAFNSSNGEATAVYNFTYQGTHTGGGRKKVILNIPEWIMKYGHRTKDSISTKAWLGSIEDIPESIGGHLGVGVILKGYPVMVSVGDVYSQTMSASPQGLKDFHANSGFVKRGDSTTAAFSIEDWLWLHDEEGYGQRGVSQETILDNWRIVGAVVNEDVLEKHGEKLGIDELDIPVHVVSHEGYVRKL